MAKYGEPWQVGAYGTDQTRIYEDGLLLDSVCTMQLANSPGWKTRQARIVACVNACAEIENPEAIPDAIAVLRTIDTWRSTGMDFPFEWLANALAALGKTRKEQ